jgi:hypothetical protein
VDKPRDQAEPDIRCLDPEEVDAVVRAEVGDELAPTLALMYRAAAMTGLRQGELIGLRWQDVDWPAGRIRVRRSYVRGEFSSPKSRRGVRSVPLADELAGELERHYQASDYQSDADLVFPHPRLGGPLDRSKVRKRFKDAVKAAGVRPVRFHDLRHTFGTRMAGVGVPMRTLQEWMGHRDFKTTLVRVRSLTPHVRAASGFPSRVFPTPGWAATGSADRRSRVERMPARPTWEQWQELLATRTHARRLMTLEEMADIAVFMASDKASGMTGTSVNLSMGSLDD